MWKGGELTGVKDEKVGRLVLLTWYGWASEGLWSLGGHGGSDLIQYIMIAALCCDCSVLGSKSKEIERYSPSLFILFLDNAIYFGKLRNLLPSSFLIETIVHLSFDTAISCEWWRNPIIKSARTPCHHALSPQWPSPFISCTSPRSSFPPH